MGFEDFPITFLHFFIYSFIGWVFESIYVSIAERRLVNRGFLFLPLCPIYGFGGVLFLFCCQPLAQWPWAVFLVATLVATALEYFTSWIMEALFGMRWWDYSNERLNINGRVCLKASLFFGVMGMFATYVVSSWVNALAAQIPENILLAGTSILFAIILLDTSRTLVSLLQLSEKLKTLQASLKELEMRSMDKWKLDWQNLKASLARLKESGEQKPLLERIESSLSYRGGGLRFLKSFPKMKATAYDVNAQEYYTMVMEHPAESISKGLRHRVISVWKHFWAFMRDWVRDIAADFSLYNLIWVFGMGSILGYLVETVFFLVVKGALISRQGLVIGPFSPIYGVGAMLMTLILAPIGKRRKNGVLFFASALLGGIYEFFCSLFMEIVMGARAWDYSDQVMQFDGRISVLYMLFWGFLGLWFIRFVYPKMASLFGRIPKRWKRTFTAVISVFLICDIVLSLLAINRWYARNRDLPAEGQIDVFLDTHFPDANMEQIFPSMHFIDDQAE